MKKHLISILAILLVSVFILSSCGGDDAFIEQLQGQIDELKEELSQAKNENKEKDKEIANLKAEMSALRAEIASLQALDTENKGKIAALEADYAAKVAELEAEKAANADALAKLETEHKATIETLEAENANLALQIEKLQAKVDELINSGDFYIVTFDVNGGEGEIEPQHIKIDTIVRAPESPTKEHYTFAGWYVNGVLAEFPYVVTCDTEFVAAYTPVTYTITYNVNDGTMPESYVSKYNVETGAILPTPTRSLYLFDGWYENAKFGGAKVTSISVGEVGNKTYYAKWLSTTDGITYELANKGTTYTVTGYEGKDTVIVIPGSVDGIPVTAIANNAFKDKQKITSITVPDSVTTIGDSAFSGCISLTELNLGNGIKTIPNYMAKGCNKLESIVIPDSVTSIGSGAFWGCNSLANAVIPNSVTSIGSYAFEYCSSLTSIVIPDSVTSIGTYTFRYCSGLTSVVMGDSITSIGSYAFYDCDNLVRVHINDLANWCNISFSDKYSNPLCYAHDLYLDGELVTKLVIPDSVTTISKWAFYSCSPLVNVVIPNSVTSIGNSAFQYCYDIYVVYNNSNLLVEIGSENNGYLAYYAKILVDNGVTTYANDGYEYILTDDGFLFREKDSKYELISYIGGEDTVTLPENINGNSYGLYYMSGVVNVIIPESFTTINDSAFRGCTSLVSVVIGDSVTSIGSEAFYNCSSLTEVYYNGSAAEWNRISINSSGNSSLKNATRYYYSETEPTTEGNFWHWVDGEVAIWE